MTLFGVRFWVFSFGVHGFREVIACNLESCVCVCVYCSCGKFCLGGKKGVKKKESKSL